MTYDELLAHTPPDSAAGNTSAAAEFVRLLTTVIETDRESFAQFSDSQQSYIYRLRTKWTKRAAGTDTRWTHHGSRPGKVAKAKTPLEPSRRQTRTDPGEETDLYKSLVRKFCAAVPDDD